MLPYLLWDFYFWVWFIGFVLWFDFNVFASYVCGDRFWLILGCACVYVVKLLAILVVVMFAGYFWWFCVIVRLLVLLFGFVVIWILFRF